jgi:hypothetical protein
VSLFAEDWQTRIMFAVGFCAPFSEKQFIALAISSEFGMLSWNYSLKLERKREAIAILKKKLRVLIKPVSCYFYHWWRRFWMNVGKEKSRERAACFVMQIFDFLLEIF